MNLPFTINGDTVTLTLVHLRLMVVLFAALGVIFGMGIGFLLGGVDRKAKDVKKSLGKLNGQLAPYKLGPREAAAEEKADYEDYYKHLGAR